MNFTFNASWTFVKIITEDAFVIKLSKNILFRETKETTVIALSVIIRRITGMTTKINAKSSGSGSSGSPYGFPFQYLLGYPRICIAAFAPLKTWPGPHKMSTNGQL